MKTDPLCPQQHTHPKHDPNRCIFCEYGEAVREDERTRWTADQKIGMATMYGYELGQRDEREACAQVVEKRGGYHSFSEFAAAIRAREEKP